MVFEGEIQQLIDRIKPKHNNTRPVVMQQMTELDAYPNTDPGLSQTDAVNAIEVSINTMHQTTTLRDGESRI